MKIGVMFGNPETTTGGKALKFYSSVRLEVRRIETITQGADDAVGNKVRVKVVKNKVAPPFRKVELEIIFGKGISASASLLDAALKYELIQKSGSWYSYGEERIGQGRENAKQFLESNEDIRSALEEQLREKMFAHLKPKGDEGQTEGQEGGTQNAAKKSGGAASSRSGSASTGGTSSDGTSSGGGAGASSGKTDAGAPDGDASSKESAEAGESELF
jgi:recombination protein RecA